MIFIKHDYTLLYICVTKKGMGLVPTPLTI
nr:MAG TPA: hypothetical protein [Caudoviricetes sp.]